MGSLGTYGFIVAYGLTCLALPRYLRNHRVFHPGAQIIPWLTCFGMLLALASNLYPVPEGAYGKLPLIFLGYLALGLLWFFWSTKRKKPALEEDSAEQTLAE
jgi:amino acid transporter